MPSREVRFLSVEEALAIHERLLDRFGGAPGVRDAGLLESALFRPRTGYYRDVAEMAAALFESLLLNRPFVDGNKRVAFFAADVFLRLNGWRLEVEAREAHAFLVGLLERGTADFRKKRYGVRHDSFFVRGEYGGGRSFNEKKENRA